MGNFVAETAKFLTAFCAEPTGGCGDDQAIHERGMIDGELQSDARRRWKRRAGRLVRKNAE